MVKALRRVALATSVGVGLFAAGVAQAQELRPMTEPPGFDFTATGVWRVRSARVRAARAGALGRQDFAFANSAIAVNSPSPSTAAVTGVLRVPVFLVRYQNSPDSSLLFARSLYDQVLFAASPPLGRPYTYSSFYAELSHGLFSVTGQVFGWTTLANNDTFYEGGGSCNGLCGSSQVKTLFTEAVAANDAAVDYGQFDNDGPDGIPNSPDDDGEVDLVVLLQPEIDGACGGNSNIWAHRYSLSGWGVAPFATNDPRTGHPGQFIKVNNYIIQSALGGAASCTAGEVMPIGTLSHETGHGLGLPDFYDTNPSDADNSEGIGEWGLMGSGNYARPLSPAHMESFSLAELGWIFVRPLTVGGTYTMGPIELGDTAFIVRPPAGVANPRGEYFLLENRQRLLADSALINKKGGTGGLLIWHVDSLKYANSTFSNSVNTGTIHGLWLMQADGRNQLRSSTAGVRNRGDGGDPYPGSTANPAFSLNSNPAPLLNGTGTPFAGFAMDSIRQVVPNGEMSFRLRFGAITQVSATDTAALVHVRGTAYAVFRDMLNTGDTATIDMDTLQFGNGGRSAYRFVSWSDGGARSHGITGSLVGATITASVVRRHQVAASVVGAGTVTAAPSISLGGTFMNDGDTVTLTAIPSPGNAFLGWSGADTTAKTLQLLLRMARPFTLTATFQVALAVLDSTLRVPVMGAAYLDTLRMTGGAGANSYVFAFASGALPPGLSLSAGGVVSGTPLRDSTYDVTILVQSGAQVLLVPLRFAVTAPTLALAAVVNRFLTGTGTLTAAETTYLDLNGNRNGVLDLGDLVAWLDRTGNQVSADLMSRIVRREQP